MQQRKYTFVVERALLNRLSTRARERRVPTVHLLRNAVEQCLSDDEPPTSESVERRRFADAATGTWQLSKELVERLQEAAEQRRMTKNALINRAIEEYLGSEEEQQ